jgi:hypothetical protein
MGFASSPPFPQNVASIFIEPAQFPDGRVRRKQKPPPILRADAEGMLARKTEPMAV